LISALQQGQESAFRQLVETYQHMVFRTALDIVQQEQEAEDVAQEVFIESYRSIHTFRGDAKLSTWLYRITIRKSLNWQRKKKAAKRFSLKHLLGIDEKTENEAKDFQHPGVLSENREDANLLFKSLKELPEKQQAAFVLLKVEGLSYEEVSAIMEVSVKALESLMHRAKENLRKKLRTHFNKSEKRKL
jgi:RNA polymerase sigma-70 factor (ECF subfamily)